MKKSNKIGIGIVLAIIAVVGIYKYYTGLPVGLTDRSEIMNKAANGLDDFVGLDMEFNPNAVSNDSDEYRIFLYRNTHTGRFVFPVEENKTREVHNCYLASYESINGSSSKIAVDINDSKWIRAVDPLVANVKGNNPAQKDYEYSIYYYYEHFSKLDDYDYIFY